MLIGKEAAHNKGQEDAVKGIHEKPHNFMDFFVNSVNPFEYVPEEMEEENEAYEAGYAHAKKQIGLGLLDEDKDKDEEEEEEKEEDEEDEEDSDSDDDKYEQLLDLLRANKSSDDDDDSDSNSYTGYSPSSESSVPSHSVINSSSNSGSPGNNDVAKQDDQGGGTFFLFIAISIMGLIAYNIPTSKESSQSINRISEQRPANLGSDVSLGTTDKPVEYEKLSDTETTTTRDDEVAAADKESTAIDNPTSEMPPVSSSTSAQYYINGTVEYIEPVNLYIRSTGHVNEPVIPDIGEKAVSGLRMFVRLDNGHKAIIIMDYDGNFNSEDRVSVISRSGESNGTIKDFRHFMTYIGIIDSEITIRLDNGGKVVIIFPSQEVIFSKGERVRAIAHY